MKLSPSYLELRFEVVIMVKIISAGTCFAGMREYPQCTIRTSYKDILDSISEFFGGGLPPQDL
jgi:hypothetical protein